MAAMQVQNYEKIREDDIEDVLDTDGYANNTSNDRGWRVKLYELEAPSKGGSWLDRGTGYVRMIVSRPKFDSRDANSFEPQASLLVLDETAVDNILVNSAIKFNETYERQGDNIIMWRETSNDSLSGPVGVDFALSFQEVQGCAEIWKAIGNMQAQVAQSRSYNRMEAGQDSDIDYMWAAGSGRDHGYDNNENVENNPTRTGGYVGRLLPPISELQFNNQNNSSKENRNSDEENENSENEIEEKLTQIRDKLYCPHISAREYLATQLLEDDAIYITKLLEIFDRLELTKNKPALTRMAEVFRNILLLNDTTLLEYLLADPNLFNATENKNLTDSQIESLHFHLLEVFYSVAGTQEYDPTLQRHADYRSFLMSRSRCVEVVCMSSHSWKVAKVKQQIQFLFRLKYVRDIMLHPTVDDPSVSALSSMIVFTTGEICNQVFSESSYLARVFQIILPSLDISAFYTPKQTAKDVSRTSINNAESSKVSNVIETDENNKENNSVDGYESDNTVVIEPRPHVQESRPTGHRLRAESMSEPSVLLPSFTNALRFLRELFYMSKILALDKRQEMNRVFYQHLKVPFLEVVLFVLYLPHKEKEEAGGGGHADSSISREDMCVGVSLTVEIVSSFAVISPQYFRKMVLDTPFPSASPLSSTTAAAPSAGQTDESKKWRPRSLLFLLIDVIVKNRCDVEIAVLEQLGDALKVSFENNPSSATALGNGTNNNNSILNAGNSTTNKGGGTTAQGNASLTQQEKQEKDKFLGLLYDHYMAWLVGPLIQPDPNPTHNHTPTPAQSARPGWMGLTCKDYSACHRILFELLIHCVQSHSYRMKYFMMRNNVLCKLVSSCFSSPESACPTREMQLSAIRFVKAVVAVKDDFYYRHIVKTDVLKPLFKCFSEIEKGRRDNLVASAVYDLLSFVKTEGVKSLIFYIVENYSDCLGNLQFVDVFEKLKIKYDQLMDYNSNSISNSLKQTDGQGIGLVRSSTLKRTKLLDLEEEEDYFFSEEEEEGEVGQGVSSRSGQGGELPAKAPRRLLDSSRRLLFGKKNNNNSNNNIDNGSAPFVAGGKARQSPSQSLLFGEGPATMGGGRAIIFHRSGSQGANPVPNPTLIGSSSSSSGSSGIHNGVSVDRFTARRASQSDNDSKSDISSLLSVYNDDDEDEETETENMHENENEAEIGTESSSGGRNGQESLIMPMLKFRPLKSVLSVPLEGQGDPSPHSELIFLPKKQEAKPLFDIFADDPDPAPSPSQSIAPSDRPMDSSADRGTLMEQPQIATVGFREGHADSCNSIMDTNITKEEGEEDDEDEDRREPALPPLKPKFESSDDDSDGPSVFTSLSHHHHHHNTTHNTTNNNNNNNNNNSQKVRIQIFKEKDNDQEKPSEITININNDNDNNNNKNNNTVNDNNNSIMNSDKKANHAAITFSIKKKPRIL